MIPRDNQRARHDRKDDFLFRVNEEIRVPQVRLVGENIANPGVYEIREALRLADQMGFDLIEVSPKAEPPVCRITDYNKFLFDQRKKAKELKAKMVKVVVKEIRFGPNTDDHDFQFKLKHAEAFLKEGSKVKAYVFFKGRTILFKEKGEDLLKKFVAELADYGKMDDPPKLEGKRMIIMMSPLPKKVAGTSASHAAHAAPSPGKAPAAPAPETLAAPSDPDDESAND